MEAGARWTSANFGAGAQASGMTKYTSDNVAAPIASGNNLQFMYAATATPTFDVQPVVDDQRQNSLLSMNALGQSDWDNWDLMNVGPLGGRVIIGDRAYSQRDVLAIAGSVQAGEAGVDPFLDSARSILRGYGYRTGELGNEAILNGITNIDQRVAMLRGDSNTNITQLQRSAYSAISASDNELSERYGLFTQGQVTRRMSDGRADTVKIDFDRNSSRLAEAIGVSAGEARAKTEWEVYRRVLDAAFSTSNLQTLQLSGLWRPSYALFTEYYASSSEARFSGLTGAQREQRRNVATTAAGITAGARWSNLHTIGNAIDIQAINGVALNNGVSQFNSAWRITIQPTQIVTTFTENLWHSGARQVLTPWRIYPDKNNLSGYRPNNPNIFSPDYVHRNHIHFGI